MRDNPFPSSFSATTGTVGGTLKRDGTLLKSQRGGTMPRPMGAVIDDYTPSYEPRNSGAQKSSKKSSGGAKAAPSTKNPGYSSKSQHNPTYIDDVDDEFDYLY